MGVKVFFLEPTGTERRWLRRYSSTASATARTPCQAAGGYCNAKTDFGTGPLDEDWQGPDHSDRRWPTKCEKCGCHFDVRDPYQKFSHGLYKNEARGIECVLQDASPGACWNADYVSDRRKDGPTGSGWMVGDDHRCLVVICPDGHQWMIDGRAKNCTQPEDKEHHCWVRHGRPEDGNLTVDKNGLTCQAGAGSIATPNYHGFLRNGEFT